MLPRVGWKGLYLNRSYQGKAEAAVTSPDKHGAALQPMDCARGRVEHQPRDLGGLSRPGAATNQPCQHPEDFQNASSRRMQAGIFPVKAIFGTRPACSARSFGIKSLALRQVQKPWLCWAVQGATGGPLN